MRKTLDKLISWTGLVLAAVLLVAGGLLMYGSNFASNNVKDQLSQQDITMPSGQAISALKSTEAQEALKPFAGQKMTNGAQAKAFADHYILEHMNAASNGRTYEEVSGEFIKMSKDASADPAQLKQLGDLRQTLFMGNTLRGLLLEAYAFGTMGTIALWAAIGAFVGAAVFLVLGILGLRHAETAPDTIGAPSGKKPVTVS